MAEATRFRDGGADLHLFADEVLVVCPRCSQRAVVSRIGDGAGAMTAPRRLVCPGCGLAQERSGRQSAWGGPVDPWFGQDLWLVERFRDLVVWAFNLTHATFLRDFVAAAHRERRLTPVGPGVERAATMSMIEKLPGWFKAASNRKPLVEVLDALLAHAA